MFVAQPPRRQNHHGPPSAVIMRTSSCPILTKHIVPSGSKSKSSLQNGQSVTRTEHCASGPTRPLSWLAEFAAKLSRLERGDTRACSSGSL
jgi:hypothetical protein